MLSNKEKEVQVYMGHVVTDGEVLGNYIDAWLSLGYEFITPDDVYNWKQGIKDIPEKSIMFTFDDGTADHYSVLYPILQAKGVKATFYLITDNVGTEGYLTWSQINEMIASGHVNIGSHYQTHSYAGPSGTWLEAEILDEIKNAKYAIESNTSAPCYHLAYPGGKYNATTHKIMTDLGIRTGRTVAQNGYGFTNKGERAPIKFNTNNYELPVSIGGTWNYMYPSKVAKGTILTPALNLVADSDIKGWNHNPTAFSVVPEWEDGSKCVKYLSDVAVTFYPITPFIPISHLFNPEFLIHCELQADVTAKTSSISIYEYDKNRTFIKAVKLYNIAADISFTTIRKLYKPTANVKYIRPCVVGGGAGNIVRFKNLYLKQIK